MGENGRKEMKAGREIRKKGMNLNLLILILIFFSCFPLRSPPQTAIPLAHRPLPPGDFVVALAGGAVCASERGSPPRGSPSRFTCHFFWVSDKSNGDLQLSCRTIEASSKIAFNSDGFTVFEFLSFRLNKQASTLEVAKRRCNKNRFVIGF